MFDSANEIYLLVNYAQVSALNIFDADGVIDVTNFFHDGLAVVGARWLSLLLLDPQVLLVDCDVDSLQQVGGVLLGLRVLIL